MVFQDISSLFDLNKVNRPKSSAQMLDRFFSFVIDYIVISPFVMFGLYFLLGEGFQFWKTNPTAPENDIFVVIVGISFVILFSLIQTYFVSIWSATPGQYFLKIKFEYEDSDSSPIVKVFIRQILFWVSMVFLGIPFLSVLADKKRRTFYDKIGGVQVVSLKNENFTVGFENEYKYWQAFMTTLSLFFGFVLAAYIYQNYHNIVGRVVSFNELKSKNFFCEDLAAVSIENRLETAVALNLVDQLSDACLDREADFVLWRNRSIDVSLAYYAKSLTAETKEKEQSYLFQACDGQDINRLESLTNGCQIASAFKEKRIEEFFYNLKPGNILNDVLKYELSKIYDDKESDELKFNRLEAYNELKGIKKYQFYELVAQLYPDNANIKKQKSTSLYTGKIKELNQLNYNSFEDKKLILSELSQNNTENADTIISDVLDSRSPASFEQIEEPTKKESNLNKEKTQKLIKLVSEL
jgi:uncharacterized RDD family membrane protein YckC